MKVFVLVVVLLGIACQSKAPADSREQRIEELRHKAQRFEAEQKKGLENDRRVAEGERRVAEQQQADSKAALQKHKEEQK